MPSSASSVLPRGLKALLRRTAPAKLVGRGRTRRFQPAARAAARDKHARVLRGLTKRLDARIWSDGELPAIARYGTVRRMGWRGEGGGRRRGTAVDAQLARVVNAGRTTPHSGQYALTNLVLAALAQCGLRPVVCQRPVCDEALRVATAIDLLCYELHTGRLVAVELKCGHSGCKEAAAARANGTACRMRAPLDRVPDNTLNRHLAQLACTHALFVAETGTL